jgi:hypothetical protein
MTAMVMVMVIVVVMAAMAMAVLSLIAEVQYLWVPQPCGGQTQHLPHNRDLPVFHLPKLVTVSA